MIKAFFRILTGWKRVVRKGRKKGDKATVWYKPIRQYEGYGDYNYGPAITRAFKEIYHKPRKYRDRVAVIRFETYFSSGRNGIGARRVQYRIGK